MLGGMTCWVMFVIDISRPACANAISLSATKNPCLVRKPLAVGSDKSQIFKKGKKKCGIFFFTMLQVVLRLGSFSKMYTN